MTPTQQMISEAFNSEVYVQNRMDVQHTPLYDSVDIAVASPVTELTTAFFTNVGAASGKTYADTNMTQSQKLPAPEAFSIFGFRIRWQENILLADLYSMMDGLAFEFYLGQKVYQRAPLWHFNAGGGILAVTTMTDSALYSNGLQSREAMHKLAIPIVIENQMTFYARLTGTAFTTETAQNGGTGIRLQVLLDGFYARGVQ